MPVAVEAVARATSAVRDRLVQTVSAKVSARDLVTDVDVAVEDMVREFLAAEAPEIGFIGEESGQAGDGSGRLTWALDPVDGTVNFVHRLPLCAVSLGLVDQRRSLLGVISLPFLDTVYAGVDGGGAHRDGELMAVSGTTRLEDALVATGDYAIGPDAAEKHVEQLAITRRLADVARRVRMLGSAALDLAWLAEGKLDAAVSLDNQLWDTSAGTLLAREAGAVVIDRDGSPHNRHSTATIAAATPQLAAAILALLDA